MPVILNGLAHDQWLLERARDLTSTDAAAILGVSPYRTAYEVWLEKAGKLANSFNDNERMKWGRRMEPVIAQGLAEDHGLEIRHLAGTYMRSDTVERMGSSFDFEVLDPQRPDLGPGDLEIKNVDSLIFRNEWTDHGNGDFEAPLHIELQKQHQYAVSGNRWGCIGVLIGGNKAVLVRRERDDNAIAVIEAAVRAFWASIEANEPPSPDWHRDGDTLRSLYANSDPAAQIAPDDEAELSKLLPLYAAARDTAKAAEEAKDALQAQVLASLKHVEKASVAGFKVSAKTSFIAEGIRKAFSRRALTVSLEGEKRGAKKLAA